jgi:hypothetical protein
MELATEQAAQAIEPPVVEPPPPVQEEAQAISQDGKIPDVAEESPEVVPDQPQQEAFSMDKGVHYIEDYQAEVARSGQTDKWQDKYAQGHSEAKQFVQPYEGRYANEWKLKAGQSASEGLEAWTKGLTLADYRAVGVAGEIDEVRDEMGDAKFDRLFGSKDSNVDSAVPSDQRLKITSAAYTTPIDDQMREIGKKADMKQDPASNDPAAWQQFEREPKMDAKAEEKKAKGDQLVEQTPVTEAKKDKTLAS